MKRTIKSSLFSTDEYVNIARKVTSFLNSQEDFLSSHTASSTRAAGDAIQDILSRNFETIVGSRVKSYRKDFSRKAMEDLAFSDDEGFYYAVDVKTHRLGTRFNMPNLTSVRKLARFYENDRNYLVILLVVYSAGGIHIDVTNVHFIPIEFLSWDCLTLGALGWGQIQIADAKKILVVPQDRKGWMIDLCDRLLEFYPAEIEKIRKTRIDYFKKVKSVWIAKQ